MNTTTLRLAAALGLGAAPTLALAQTPFRVDAAGTGQIDDPFADQPIQVIDGEFYQNPFATDSAPPAAFLAPVLPALIGLEYDTYIGLDGFGPSTPTYSSRRPIEVLRPFDDSLFSSDQAAGIWTANLSSAGRILSDDGGGAFDIFLGRFTHNGSALAGALRLGNVSTAPSGGPVGRLPLNLDGTPNNQYKLSNDAIITLSQFYRLETREISIPADVQDVIGPNFRTFDLYVVAIPSPHAAALLPLAGVAAVRRRR